MAYFSKKRVEELLAEGQVALSNALNTPEILALLTPLGYDAVKLQEGQTLRTDLETKHQDQMRVRALQKEATAALNTVWSETRRTHGRHRRIARAVLADNVELMSRIGLDAPRPRGFYSAVDQVKQFYREGQADAGLQAILDTGGLTAPVLQSSEAKVVTVVDADMAQEAAKGVAQQATQERNAAAAVFKDWMRKFWKIADVALADHPQWLESLGRRVRS